MSAGAAQDYLTHRGGVIAPREAKLVTGDEREDRSAFVHITPHAIPLPVLIAVPHAGRAYSEDVIAGMRDPEQSQLRLEDRYVDAVGVEVGGERSIRPRVTAVVGLDPLVYVGSAGADSVAE